MRLNFVTNSWSLERDEYHKKDPLATPKFPFVFMAALPRPLSARMKKEGNLWIAAGGEPSPVASPRTRMRM